MEEGRKKMEEGREEMEEGRKEMEEGREEVEEGRKEIEDGREAQTGHVTSCISVASRGSGEASSTGVVFLEAALAVFLTPWLEAVFLAEFLLTADFFTGAIVLVSVLGGA